MMNLIRKRYQESNGEPLPILYDTMIWDIVNKLSRLSVTPDHIDTVHDISGYARLYEQVLRSSENANE
jgi:hypothetical protein